MNSDETVFNKPSPGGSPPESIGPIGGARIDKEWAEKGSIWDHSKEIV
jgi:hypothetical protein